MIECFGESNQVIREYVLIENEYNNNNNKTGVLSGSKMFSTLK